MVTARLHRRRDAERCGVLAAVLGPAALPQVHIAPCLRLRERRSRYGAPWLGAWLGESLPSDAPALGRSGRPCASGVRGVRPAVRPPAYSRAAVHVGLPRREGSTAAAPAAFGCRPRACRRRR